MASNGLLAITIPPGMGPGSELIVQAPDGRKMKIVVPPGMRAGQQLQVAMPKAPPQAGPASGSRDPVASRMLGKPPPPASAPQKKLSTSVGSDDQRLNNLMARLAEGNDTKKITRQVAKQALDDADGHVGKAYGVLSRSAHAMGMNTLVGGGSRPHQPRHLPSSSSST